MLLLTEVMFLYFKAEGDVGGGRCRGGRGGLGVGEGEGGRHGGRQAARGGEGPGDGRAGRARCRVGLRGGRGGERGKGEGAQGARHRLEAGGKHRLRGRGRLGVPHEDERRGDLQRPPVDGEVEGGEEPARAHHRGDRLVAVVREGVCDHRERSCESGSGDRPLHRAERHEDASGESGRGGDALAGEADREDGGPERGGAGHRRREGGDEAGVALNPIGERVDDRCDPVGKRL